jgi:HK97 family phage major capsid protein
MNLADFVSLLETEKTPEITPGDALITSDAYKRSKGNERTPVSVELPKANIRATLTSTGLTSFTRPTDAVTLGAQRLYVRDLLPQGTMDSATVRYTRETAIPTYTGSLTTAEDTAKKEVTWSITEVDAPARKIAVIGRISTEAWSDQSFTKSYVNSRLSYLVKLEEEKQLLNGNGTSPNLQGIMTVSGIQTMSGATGKTFENIMIAMTNVRVNALFEPDGIVLHPTDYRKLRLAADTNGQLYGGGFFYGPFGQGGVSLEPAVWGLKTVVTTNISAGTILLGSFAGGGQIFDREGLHMDTSETDASDWSENRIAVRLEERLTQAIFRPSCFHLITAIP